MKQLDYGGRAMLHDSAAIALYGIYKLSEVRAREQKMCNVDEALGLSRGLCCGSTQRFHPDSTINSKRL